MSEQTAKAYHRISEFQQDVLDSRNKIFERGFDVGFQSAKNIYNLKKKSTSIDFASPYSGKTAYTFDILIHIAARYDAKICCFSPEAGGRESLVAYLAQVYMGKKLHGHNAQQATDKEWIEALQFLDEHFVILAPKVVGKDKINFTTSELFSQVHRASLEYGWKFDILLVDTHAMLRKSDEEKKSTIADYILENLYYFNHVADSMDMHIKIIMHSADDSTIVDKDSGIEYIPKPHPNRIANGKNIFRTSQQLLGIWRCPAGVHEKQTGCPYPENATDFFVQKNKIQGAGTTGSFRLYYDEIRQKFYEIIDGKRYYCGEYEEQQKLDNPTNNMPISKLF